MPAKPKSPDRQPAARLRDTASTTLTVTPLPAAVNPSLTPAQQAFNRLLARVDRLTADIEAVRAAVDAHRPMHVASMDALHREHEALVRRMASWLDQRLRMRGLTKSQQRQMTELIIALSEALAGEGDEAMRRLHDSYSDEDLDAKLRAGSRELKAELEAALGEPLDEVGDGTDMESLLRAATKQVQAQELEAEAQRQARQAERQARRATKGKPGPSVQEALDAQGLLRTLFRQLASALHPDRESDPTERLRKSELMSEVNTAYARRDLTALLRLQLRVELANPQAIARLADEKAGALSRLLKDQVATLQRALERVQSHARLEFGMAPFGGVDAATLSRSLQLQRQALQQQINQLHQELMLVQDDAQFKRWLRAQSAWV